jgi:oligoribonuclease
MLLIFLDSETTGIDPESHRVIDIAFKVVDLETHELITSYESLVFQPMEVWALADPESLQITGLSYEKLMDAPSEKVVASEIAHDLNLMRLQEKSGIFICQNPSFDRLFFNQLISGTLQDEYGWPYHWLDLASMYYAKRLMQDEKWGKALKEQDLSKNRIAEHYGLAPERKPHRAMNGVNHLMECYRALFRP